MLTRLYSDLRTCCVLTFWLTDPLKTDPLVGRRALTRPCIT